MSTNQDDASSFSWLTSNWREDFDANKRNPLAPGFHAVALHRFGVWSRNQGGLAGWILNKLYAIAYVFVSVFYGIELPRAATVGRRLWLPHPAGVVVSNHAQIGDDCMIRQNVTIGQFKRDRSRIQVRAPKLGNGVRVGAGAVIVGGVTVGDNARIGPNAVVMTDVPSGGSAFARPAEVMPSLAPSVGTKPAVPAEGEAYETEQQSPLGDVYDFIELIDNVIRPDESIDADTPVISTGIIDSFDVVVLLTAVESQYGVNIAPEEIDIDWFDSPTQMLELIRKRLS